MGTTAEGREAGPRSMCVAPHIGPGAEVYRVSSVCSAAGGLRCTATASGEYTCPGPPMLQPGTLSLGGPPLQPDEVPGQGPETTGYHKHPGGSWARLCRLETEAGVRGIW